MGFMTTQVIPKAMVTMTKAAPSSKISLTQSMMLGEKLSATADGVDEVKINVFVMDDTGKGIAGKLVSVTGLEGIQALGSELSDTDGKVAFKATSTVDGQFALEGLVEGIPLPRKVTVTFKVR